MSRLEELRQLVADMFEGATEKEQIEKFATLNNAIDGVSKEQDSLVAKNADLIKSYKELVKHTSFSTGDKPVDGIGGTPLVSIDEALKQTLANMKK